MVTEQYPDRKNKLLTSLVLKLLALPWDSIYDVKYKGLTHLDRLRHDGIVLLANHQSLLDIGVCGKALMKQERQGHYVMRSSLPAWLELIGGISINRGKEYKATKKGNINQQKSIGPREKNKIAYQRVAQSLSQNQPVVMYPSGTRTQRKTNLTDRSVEGTLRNILTVQGQIGSPVPFVPVKITYEAPVVEELLEGFSFRNIIRDFSIKTISNQFKNIPKGALRQQFRAKIYMDIGRPFTIDETLEPGDQLRLFQENLEAHISTMYLPKDNL